MAGSLYGGFLCDRFGRRTGMFIGERTIQSARSRSLSYRSLRLSYHHGRLRDNCELICPFTVHCWSICFGNGHLGCHYRRPDIYRGGRSTTMEVNNLLEFTQECGLTFAFRGRLTSLYNTGWNGGAIPAAAITLATSRMQSDWSWRIPLILQAFPATLVVFTVWFLPESPRRVIHHAHHPTNHSAILTICFRWLMAHGRTEEAFDFLIKYHGNGDPEHPIVKLQMTEFSEGIRTDGADKRWWDFK